MWPGLVCRTAPGSDCPAALDRRSAPATCLLAGQGASCHRGSAGDMNLLLGFIAQLLHIALIAAAALSLVGLLRWLQARLSGHVGPPVLQPWRDLFRLLRKQPVLAES